MPSSDPVRRLFSGLFAVAALAAVIVLARNAMDGKGTDDGAASSGTPAGGEAAPDPETVRSFYDAAIKRIEDSCSPTDKSCERRVKKQVATEHGIPEDQADAVFFGEALRRGRQGR